MRLSDAIALGRTLVKPHRLAEYYEDGSGCARGMALEACNARAHSDDYNLHDDAFYRLWPWTSVSPNKAPCNCQVMSVYPFNAQIQHLFDSHVTGIAKPTWTLDQLIDWVRSVEPDEEPEQSLEDLEAQRVRRLCSEALLTLRIFPRSLANQDLWRK
jgi:hypothetical protein